MLSSTFPHRRIDKVKCCNVDAFGLFPFDILSHVQSHQNLVEKGMLFTWFFHLCPCSASVFWLSHPLFPAFSTALSIPSSTIGAYRYGSDGRKEGEEGWQSGCVSFLSFVYPINYLQIFLPPCRQPCRNLSFNCQWFKLVDVGLIRGGREKKIGK